MWYYLLDKCYDLQAKLSVIMLDQYHVNLVCALEAHIFYFFILLWNSTFLAEIFIWHIRSVIYNVRCMRTGIIGICLYLNITMNHNIRMSFFHDDVIKWKHFPRYWPFLRGIHRSPVNSTHKGRWRGALMFSLTCASINGWVNNCEAGDLRRYRANYDVNVFARLGRVRASSEKIWDY